ncbi:unnamed protein product [Gordionus sp. m RMFG-2023]
MPALTCRFYKQKYPEIDDVVVVNVHSIAEMGAYVTLLEYDNIEGMILLSELSRRRIRSINKLIRVGRNECVVVIRVDKEKGNLIFERVSPEDIRACEEKYARAKSVNSILRQIANVLNYETKEELETLHEKIAWHFDDKYKRQAACFEIFKSAISDPKVFDECGIDEHTKDILLTSIKRRLTPQPVKIRADIEVSCYNYYGIEAIKNALRKGIDCSTEEMPIKINLIAPPLYVITTNTLEKTDGLNALNESIKQIQKDIESNGGHFNVKMPPTIVTDTDEAELQKQLEKLEQANAEVDGDEDDENVGEDGDEETDDILTEEIVVGQNVL